MALVPAATLSSGHKIPLVGLGTASASLPPLDEFVSIILAAVEMGYRHFDSAVIYRTEQPLGTAVVEVLRRGLVQSRDELFITSKLWLNDAHPDLVLPTLKKTLQNLGLEYIDLYLIHWPLSMKRGDFQFPVKKEDFLPMDFKGVWGAMEECHRLGLVKSIGVSNFSCKKLQHLLALAEIPPAVNQVEMNPAWQQRRLVEFCKEKNIHLSAWSPLSANGAPWGSFNVMQNPILKQIAEGKGKSIAQVSLRWLHQQGVSIIVKSFNRDRMKENLQIFDWELTREELDQISEIPQQRGCSGDSFVSPHGPYRTIEELWDGEI